MPQGSDEWLEVRRGKLTGSNAQAIATNGRGLETYVYTLLADKYSNHKVEGYINADMERGNELEEQARELYSLSSGTEIQEVGFIERDEYVGCSPDGLVGDDGGIEIKCHNDAKHFTLLLGGKMEKKYWWQIQMNLLITGRKWWEYIAYNPNFDQAFYVERIKPDEEAFEKLEEGIKKGTDLIKKLTKNYERLRDTNSTT